MARKSILARQKAQEALKKFEEATLQAASAQDEENLILEQARAGIEEIIKNAGLFCGFRVNVEGLKNLISVMLEKQITIDIPFELYFIDKEQDNQEIMEEPSNASPV
jgi:hypothetical protein